MCTYVPFFLDNVVVVIAVVICVTTFYIFHFLISEGWFLLATLYIKYCIENHTIFHVLKQCVCSSSIGYLYVS